MPTTYYIRKTGSDSNNGTSAATAWATIGKALGASGIASGDTVYIGAGTYRETVTVAMTSATVETKLIGDVDGVQTGDVGDIVWTAYTTNDVSTPSSSAVLTTSARDFLTFKFITFISGGGTICTASATSTDITFYRCCFIQQGVTSTSVVSITVGAGVAANWTFDSCVMLRGPSNGISITLTTGTGGADWDSNIQIKNCLFLGGGTSSPAVNITSSGTSANEGGGVDVTGCTILGGVFVATNTTRVSVTIPCTVQYCFIYCAAGTALNSSESGNLTEDYNVICTGTPRALVAVGTHSVSDGSIAPLVEIGQSFLNGGILRPIGVPLATSGLIGFGNSLASDLFALPNPSGTIKYGASGTATAGAAKTLTDSGAAWGTSKWLGWTVKITGGTGSGQTKTIASHTATVLTVDGNWKTNPDSTSTYMIYQGAMSSSGTATAGTTTTLTDSNAAWGTNMWTGYTLKIDGGTGSGQALVVTSNTATAITFATATAPDNTSTYKLYRGTDENTVNNTVGCYERGNTWGKETGTVRTGSNALSQLGPGVQDFDIPVDATSTTVTVYVRWDSNYAGTKPQMKVLNGTECGVADASTTATGSANAWEQLSLNFTPTSAGVVTIRIQSNCTTPTGWAFADDFAVA